MISLHFLPAAFNKKLSNDSDSQSPLSDFWSQIGKKKAPLVNPVIEENAAVCSFLRVFLVAFSWF